MLIVRLFILDLQYNTCTNLFYRCCAFTVACDTVFGLPDQLATSGTFIYSPSIIDENLALSKFVYPLSILSLFAQALLPLL